MIKINFSLKPLLILLVLIGTGVVLILSVVNLITNQQLLKNQNWLTDIVIPLEVVTQEIQTIIADFITRDSQITAVTTLRELEELAKHQNESELALAKNEDQLQALTSQVAEITPLAEIKQALTQLTSHYEQFYQTDQAIFALVRQHLALEEDIYKQLNDLHQLGTQLSIQAEGICGKVNFFLLLKTLLIRQLIDNQEEINLANVLPIVSQRDLIQFQMACMDLTVAVNSLGTYELQLLLDPDRNNLISVKENQIMPAFQLAELAMKKLHTQIAQSQELSAIINQIRPALQATANQVKAELTTLVEEMVSDFSQLQAILVTGNQSILILQTQRLQEQEEQSQQLMILRKTAAAIKANLTDLRKWAKTVNQLAKTQAEQIGEMSKKIVITVSILAILVLMITSTLLARRILVTIKQVVDFAQGISQGDFTTQIQVSNHQDEIGQLVLELSRMATHLSSLLSQIQRAGIQVASSATELAATAKQQKATMLTQVESTNTVEKSVATISRLAAELVQTMQQVANLSVETAEFASHGQTNLLRLAEATQSMENASQSISNKLSAIHDKTENITTVVTTITKVAEQTNLLSLNAAIEAEKAGESGRGFNVVAREIRRLADQTAVATLDIEHMVKEMQRAVDEGVMEMENFSKEMHQSAQDVALINTQMKRIIEQVRVLSPRFEDINAAMANQANHVHQINQAMIAVSNGMRQTAETLEESLQAIEQLNEAARNLQYEVSRFKVKT
jgi:methyl-accepting chemotaxis protein WspA